MRRALTTSLRAQRRATDYAPDALVRLAPTASVRRALSTSVRATSVAVQRRATDYVADVLVRQGVKNVFGGHGGAVIPLIDSIATHPGLRWVYMRNEQAASLAAAADAKLTGELAVCVATSGPGASHLTTGLVDAVQVRGRSAPRARRPRRASDRSPPRPRSGGRRTAAPCSRSRAPRPPAPSTSPSFR